MSDDLVLVVEDEDKIAEVLTDYLQASGLRTHRIAHGRQVIDWVNSNSPSAILLDAMLPGRSGFDICREIRIKSSVPIMMITARSEEADRLGGFDAGADDYVCKPFSPREVAARTQALLRRAKGGGRRTNPSVLELDAETYCAEANGRKVALTAVEFDLLSTLMKTPGRIFSRDEIMDRVYADFRIVNDRTIDSHVKKLRRKLDQLQLPQQPVRSVYGIGYKFDP